MSEFRIGIIERGRVEIRAASLTFLPVQVGGEVFRDEAVEQHTEHVGFEVPSVDAAVQVVGDAPDGFVQFRALGVVIRYS